ncbi:MAG: carbonic anhydrase [Vicinamibacteria bacterium]|nr:carbonic anhydrase [Vicinamibacteria bacterium]
MPDQLIDGLKRFKREHFPRYREHYERLVAEGQRPTTLFIGCSDSRVVPNLLTDTGPGELFIVRNMGSFVPPFEPDAGYHGTSASIEFSVLHLGVKDIVVCGHSDCGAIQALYAPVSPATPHIAKWLDLAREAMAGETLCPEGLRRTEWRSVILQIERLMDYPMVRERVDQGKLCLHGWHYVIEEGTVHLLDVTSGQFAAFSDY